MNLLGRLLRRAAGMTPIILIVCLAAARPATGAQQPTKLDPDVLKRTGVYHALVIGSNDYVRLPRLETAVKDAQDVASILRSLYGFEVKLLLNATRDQIMRSISEYRRTLNDADHLLIYYAGHGYFDRGADRAYWQPVDAESDNNANWISSDDITANMRAMPARHILVVADSCYSGALRSAGASITPADKSRFLLQVKNKRSRTLLSSGGVEPVTDGGGAVNSVFAEAFIQGLSAAEDPAFSAGTLFHDYIRIRVPGRAKQTPLYNAISNSGDEGGDFVFIKTRTAKPADTADADNSLWYHNRGTLYLDDGKYAEAEAEYRKAVSLEPNKAIFRVRLGAALYGQRKYAEAEVAIREAIRLDPREADYWNRLGNTLWALDRVNDAEQAYRAGLAVTSEHVWLNGNLARALNRRGDFAGAEPYVRKALALSPRDADVLHTLALTLGGLKRFADAESAFKRSLDIDAKRPAVWNDYGNLLFNSGSYAASETCYRKAVELGPDIQVYRTNLAGALWNQRKYAEAEAAARDVIRVNDANPIAHFWTGRALYANERYGDAERAFRRAVVLESQNSEYHNWLGNAMFSQNRFQDAELEYKEAIRLSPKSQYFQVNLAGNYAKWNRPDLAEQYYRQAAATAPADMEVRRYLGVFYFRQNRLAEARTVFEEILQREPGLELNYRNLANALLKLKDLVAAESAARRALALKGDLADSHILLGEILEAQGKLADALGAFETAAKLAPQGKAPAEVARLRGKLGSGK